jgi:hypothetical protein
LLSKLLLKIFITELCISSKKQKRQVFKKVMQLISTRTIKDAIKNGYTSDFVHLLEEFGKWSSFFGCQGWGKGAAPESYVLDDDTGAVLDIAFAYLQHDHKELYRLMRMRYIQGMSEIQIMREERERLSAKNKRFRYMTADMIAERIKVGNIYILELLQHACI